MSLAQDLGLHVSTHLEHLKTTLHGGVPAGLSAQLTEPTAVLATLDGTISKVYADEGLSARGKDAQRRAAYDAAKAALNAWRVARTEGIDKQLAVRRAALLAEADRTLPVPTDLQVQNLTTRLTDFDPLEVEVLYASASDGEKRVIEAAATVIGRQPVRRGERVVWEPLISTETMTAAIAERAERVNPEAAAQLRDLQRIRNTYEAVASAGAELLAESLPVGERVSVA